ncbi:MAG: DciA family protein [Alphaproteobacteria bacterium]
MAQSKSGRRSKKPHGPRALAAALPSVTKPLFRERGFAQSGVLNDWPDIVGQPLADNTAPERLGRDGTLDVRVSGGWALELKHLEPVVLERIATYFGYRAVTRLAITQGPLPPRPKKNPRRTKTLSPDDAKDLENRLADTEDPALRKALARLGHEVLGKED